MKVHSHGRTRDCCIEEFLLGRALVPTQPIVFGGADEVYNILFHQLTPSAIM